MRKTLRLGWFALWLGKRHSRLRPISIGHAREKWSAHHFWGRIYLVSVKPRDAHRQPGWVKGLREFARSRRTA